MIAEQIAHINRTLDLCPEHALDLNAKCYTPDIIERVAKCHWGEQYDLAYFDEHALIPDLLPKAQAIRSALRPSTRPIAAAAPNTPVVPVMCQPTS